MNTSIFEISRKEEKEEKEKNKQWKVVGIIKQILKIFHRLWNNRILYFSKLNWKKIANIIIFIILYIPQYTNFII